MALSTVAKEQDNFLRYAILIVDHSKEALRDLIELNLRNKHLTFEEFLNQNQHEIYHLCYDSKCCQCHTSPPRRKRIICPSQLELLFDKLNKFSTHTATSCTDFCCGKSKVNITTEVLDISLARCLLVNCCLDVFWLTCLTAQGQTLEQFLNSNKHIIYHLWKNNQSCCQCPAGFIIARDYPIITENEWRCMFSNVLLPCINDRKRTSTGTTSVCSVAARPGIDVKDIHREIQGLILKWCCSVRKSVEKLVEFRNINFGHVKDAKLSDSNFKDFFKKTEECILDIAVFFGKDKNVKDAITNLHSRPIDARLCSHYQNILLENINRNEAIRETINLQHRTTRRSIPGFLDKSCKIRKIEERVYALEKSNAEIKEDIQDIHKLVKEGTKRQRLIDQTSAEIESHKKEGTYLETEAVRQCIQLLECRNVVILSGREGSGKSRNGLEILKQLKERQIDSDVFKLIGLHYVSDIVKCNVTSIVLFDDAFDKTSEHLSYEKQVLNHLHSYISQNKVKVIFTMRNYVRHACHMLLSTHEIFREFVDIDLNSKKFKLTAKEKEEMLTIYCAINKIWIFEEEKKKKDNAAQSVANGAEGEDNEGRRSQLDPAGFILKRKIMNEIIETDPLVGFPECCRLFTMNSNRTHLDASCFKWPSSVLINDIENLRIEGQDNHMNGLKYVTFVYILTQGKCYNSKDIRGLARKDINVETFKKIHKVFYNKNHTVHTSDIENVCNKSIDFHLFSKDGTFWFQHKAIQDSVLISCSKIICPSVIIPLLSFDHMIDMVRPHSYLKQKDETIIQISKLYHYVLAKQIISLLGSVLFKQNKLFRLIESKLITENDVDLSYQLILCIHNQSSTLSSFLANDMTFITDYFPLYLLNNIGKLDDNLLNVNHIKKGQMLISATFGEKHVTFSVDPDHSINWAFLSKYKDIVKWLFKNTDHSLLCISSIFLQLRYSYEVVQFTLENVNHDIIDMTLIFMDLIFGKCYYNGRYSLEWILDNIDNSLIDFNICFENLFENDNELVIVIILKKVNHKFFDVNKLVIMSCKHGMCDLLELMLQNVDPQFFEKEDLIKIAIDHFIMFETGDDIDDIMGYNKIVEILLQNPVIKCWNTNTLFDVAKRGRWYNVLELLFIQDVDKSINKDKIVEDIYEDWNFQKYEVDVYEVAHFTKSAQLIMKYYSDHIVINKILKIAVEFGIHNCFEELLLDKVDNTSYYLNITLSKLRSKQLYRGLISFDKDHGKILLLLLQRINNKCMNLNCVMEDLCHIGHSSAVLLLLEKNPYHRFNMKNVMKKACYYGDIKLVDYLFRKYSADDFDFKTAMNKACRNQERDVCNWLWANIERSMFDMKAALNNAIKYDSTENVKWILTDVDKELYDIEAAVLYASEHGNKHTLKLLLKQSGLHLLDSQSALTLSCRNDRSCLGNAKLLYRCANKSNLDMNAILSEACTYFRTDFIQWKIETCNKNITVFKTNDGHKHFIKSLDKHCVDVDLAVTFILNMKDPAQKKDHLNKTKKKLLMLILKQSDPSMIYIYTLLAETCKDDWVEIYQWILERVDYAHLNICEIINVACRFGAFNIIKWSLENIDMQVVDVDNVMVESCGFGWLDCLVLLLKHCNQYKLQAAMTEACTYGRLHIAEWLLQNVHSQFFNIPMLLQEAGRNGWINIFTCLLQNFHFNRSDMHIATNQALENGHLEIAELVISTFGRNCFDFFSPLSETVYVGANKEGVVNFLLHNIDHRSIDIATIMTNACLFGWKDVATFIVDNDFSSRCDLSLAFNTACDNGELEIVQLLIDKVDLHILTTIEKAMHSVAVKGWDKIAILLLDKVKHTRLDIGNAFKEACQHGEIDVVQAILRKVDNTMLDVETALYKACENHMHEELVLWMLENINQQQVDLKTVKKQAIRHKWRKVRFAIPEIETKDLNEAEQEIETDNIIILE